MESFGAIVRIGHPVDHRTQDQVDDVLNLHVQTGCWSSFPARDVRPGMPMIASHIGAGQGQFLVGVFTGDTIDVPWPTPPEHANHVGHRVVFLRAVFLGDPDAIEGATCRSLQWLSTAEFVDAYARLRVGRDVLS